MNAHRLNILARISRFDASISRPVERFSGGLPSRLGNDAHDSPLTGGADPAIRAGTARPRSHFPETGRIVQAYPVM